MQSPSALPVYDKRRETYSLITDTVLDTAVCDANLFQQLIHIFTCIFVHSSHCYYILEKKEKKVALLENKV